MRQASEQYLIDSQFFSHDFRQVISLLQTTQILLGKKDLFPLKAVFMGFIDDQDYLILAEHAQLLQLDQHHQSSSDWPSLNAYVGYCQIADDV